MNIAQKIRDRLSEVKTARSAEIERHRRALDEIDHKVSDFEAALRAIAEIEAESAIEQAVDELISGKDGNARPEGLPSMPDMIRETLGASSIPLEPKELLGRIRVLFWDGFESGDVGSTAWRMWRRGELMKEGSAYRLPQTNEAPQGVATPESASEPEETKSLF